MLLRTGCLLLTLASFGAEAAVIPQRIETALRDRIAAGELPAAVVAMVDDDAVQIEGFGALPDGKAPDGDTLFEIGSVSKTFTAVLLAQDVIDGRVALDQPVRTLLPGFSVPSRDGRDITLADIAEQDSGLPRMPDNFHPADQNNPYADYDGTLLKSFLAGYKLPRAPGAQYEYSNLAVGLLGYALAQSRHTTYGDLVAERIFKPLGMASSGVALPPELLARLAPGFDAQNRPAHPWDMDALAGAGGIRSSGADMLRYLDALMGKAPTGLRAAFDLAKTPRRPVAEGQKIGLIWMTAERAGEPIVWHNGMTGGYASFLGFTADRRRGVVILVNQAVSVDELGFAALDDKAILAPAHKAVAMTADQLETYVGTYKLRDRFFISIIRAGDQLFARATGQGAFPIYASGPDEFFAKIAGIAFSFTRDGQNEIAGLVLHQGGDLPAAKLSDRDAAAQMGAIPVDEAALKTYAGRYELAPGREIELSVDHGQLMARIKGQPASPVFASAPDKFFYLVVEAEIDFQRGENGAVTGLVLHQNGQSLPAARLMP